MTSFQQGNLQCHSPMLYMQHVPHSKRDNEGQWVVVGDLKCALYTSNLSCYTAKVQLEIIPKNTGKQPCGKTAVCAYNREIKSR